MSCNLKLKQQTLKRKLELGFHISIVSISRAACTCWLDLQFGTSEKQSQRPVDQGTLAPGWTWRGEFLTWDSWVGFAGVSIAMASLLKGWGGDGTDITWWFGVYMYVSKGACGDGRHHQRVGPSSAFVLISSSFDPFYGFLSPSTLCTLAYEGMYNNFCMVVIRRSLRIGHVSLLVGLIAWIN